MNNVFVFSKSNFEIEFNGEPTPINKNSFAKIIDPQGSLLFKQNNQALEVHLNNLHKNNYYNYWTIKDNIYIELISCSFKSLNFKFNTKSCEVFVYESAVLIIYKNQCYSHCFKSHSTTNVMEKDNILYILNSQNLITFNLNALVFSYLNVIEYNKTQNIELLCKIPRTNCYFLHFTFDLEHGETLVKKLKNDNLNNRNIPVQYLAFNLCKYDFNDSNLLFDKSIDFDQIKNYFKKFDQLIEIENTFFAQNISEICEVKFEIANNLILDID